MNWYDFVMDKDILFFFFRLKKLFLMLASMMAFFMVVIRVKFSCYFSFFAFIGGDTNF
jgi:hypothetical protein